MLVTTRVSHSLPSFMPSWRMPKSPVVQYPWYQVVPGSVPFHHHRLVATRNLSWIEEEYLLLLSSNKIPFRRRQTPPPEKRNLASISIKIKLPPFLYLVVVSFLIACSLSALPNRADFALGHMRILHWRTFPARTRTEDDERKLPPE